MDIAKYHAIKLISLMIQGLSTFFMNDSGVSFGG